MKPARLLVVIALLSFLAPYSTYAQAAQDAANYRGLAHIQIQTRDIEKSIRFYQDNLHFVVVDRSDMTRPTGMARAALLKQGSCLLELSQPANPDSVLEKTRGTVGHFALWVGSVDKAVAELKTKGITPDRDPANSDQLFGGIRMAFISGPSGESIELFEYLNPNSKGAQVK
jgi:catechol 2,3-dioxygenase-like lactoylglutathione lyase family enzyme